MDLRLGPRFEFAFRLRFGCFLNTSHAVLAFWNCVLSDMACKYWFVWFGHFGLRSGLAFWVAFWASAADSLSLLLRFGVAFRFLSQSMLLCDSISLPMTTLVCILRGGFVYSEGLHRHYFRTSTVAFRASPARAVFLRFEGPYLRSYPPCVLKLRSGCVPKHILTSLL